MNPNMNPNMNFLNVPGQGRKPKWNSSTKAIRVPEKYADRLIEIARQWESAEPGCNS